MSSMGNLARKPLIGLVALLAALLFSCGGEKDSPAVSQDLDRQKAQSQNQRAAYERTGATDARGTSGYLDLIAEFPAARKLAMTESIVFENDDLFETMYGWSPWPTPWRWSDGLESKMRIVARQNEKITMDVECRPQPSENHSEQTMSVYLGDRHIQDIVLTNARNIYRVELPGEYVGEGINVVTFRYAYAIRPEVLKHPNVKWAVAFKRIDVGHEKGVPGGKILVEGDSVLQQPDTFLNYYYHLPGASRLQVDLDLGETGLAGFIRLETDDGKSRVIACETSGSQDVDLSEFSDKFTKVSFLARQNPETTPSKSGIPLVFAKWTAPRIVFANAKEPTVGQEAAAPNRSGTKDFGNCDVVYIVLDAFHAKHSDIYGYERETTPFLRKVSKDAVVFEQMYANGPFTLPSTATLFTSKYSHVHGLYKQETTLSPTLPTMAEVFSNEGIETCLVSDHPLLKGTWGLRRGFERIFDDKDYSYKPDELVAALNEIYGAATEKRRFVYIHLIPPHSPYLPPKQYRIFMDWKEGFVRTDTKNLIAANDQEIQLDEEQLDYFKAMYDANILYADHLAKTILDCLEQNGARKKSVVFIASDHGEAFQEHGWIGHGRTVYDEMIHVPFLILFPEGTGIAPGRIDALTSLRSLPGTVSEIFNIDGTGLFDGTSLLSVVEDGSAGPEYVYSENYRIKQRTLRSLSYKLIVQPGKTQFFDLSNDPGEKANLVSERPIAANCYTQIMEQSFHRAGSGKKEENQVDLKKLDEETIQKMRQLGYIK